MSTQGHGMIKDPDMVESRYLPKCLSGDNHQGNCHNYVFDYVYVYCVPIWNYSICNNLNMFIIINVLILQKTISTEILEGISSWWVVEFSESCLVNSNFLSNSRTTRSKSSSPYLIPLRLILKFESFSKELL